MTSEKELTIAHISNKLNVDKQDILKIIENMIIEDGLESEYKLSSTSFKIKEYSLNNYLNKAIAFKIASQVNMKKIIKNDNVKLDVNPYKNLEFQYSFEKCQNLSFNHFDVVNLNDDIVIDYKNALEYIALFSTKAVDLHNACKVTIINLNDELLEIYKTIFDYVENGGTLVYHASVGIPKKLYGNKKYLLNAKKELLSDLKYQRHGDIVFQDSQYKREQHISNLILHERIKLLYHQIMTDGMSPIYV